jgi:hydroxymethylbilane synthase
MLAVLDGSCRTPIAALAEIERGELTIEGLLLTPDGRREVRERRTGAIADAAAIGSALGEVLRQRAGPEFGLG